MADHKVVTLSDGKVCLEAAYLADHMHVKNLIALGDLEAAYLAGHHEK